MLAAPLNVTIMRALATGPKRQAELRRETEAPAQSTLRAQLKRLDEIGAIEKQRRNRFPGVLEYELTGAGRELLRVADVLDRWLRQAPAGHIDIGGNAARAAVKALAAGWSSTMLRALAARPLSLTELSGVIASHSYPSIERRLAAMRLVGQVEACPEVGRITPYRVTPWLRRGLAPLLAATRWERHHSSTSPPCSPLDVETTFLLALPLIEPHAVGTGSCRLTADIAAGKPERLGGVVVELCGDGSIASCSTKLEGRADAWASGPVNAWLGALIDRDVTALEFGGDGSRARGLIDGLHSAVFSSESRRSLDAIR